MAIVLAVDAPSWFDMTKKSAQSPSVTWCGLSRNSPGRKRQRQFASRLHGGSGDGYQKMRGRGPAQCGGGRYAPVQGGADAIMIKDGW